MLGVCLGHQCIGAGLRRRGGAGRRGHARQDLVDHPRRARGLRRSARPAGGHPVPLAGRRRRPRCRGRSRSPPGPTTGRSWGCATGACRSKGSSSTPSRSSPPGATACGQLARRCGHQVPSEASGRAGGALRQPPATGGSPPEKWTAESGGRRGGGGRWSRGGGRRPIDADDDGDGRAPADRGAAWRALALHHAVLGLIGRPARC